MNKFKGWRTLTFNALAAILPIMQLAEFQAIIPPDWLPWYMLAIVLANMGLRAITTTPMGKRELEPSDAEIEGIFSGDMLPDAWKRSNAREGVGGGDGKPKPGPK